MTATKHLKTTLNITNPINTLNIHCYINTGNNENSWAFIQSILLLQFWYCTRPRVSQTVYDIFTQIMFNGYCLIALIRQIDEQTVSSVIKTSNFVFRSSGSLNMNPPYNSNMAAFSKMTSIKNQDQYIYLSLIWEKPKDKFCMIVVRGFRQISAI